MPRWYYAIGKQKHGPVSTADMQAMLRSGQLQVTDMVLQEGARKWIPAGSVEAYVPVTTAPPAGYVEPAKERVWTPRLSWLIIKRAAHQWWNHDCPQLGASLAFYGVFSLVPLLWLALRVAASVSGEHVPRKIVTVFITNIADHRAAEYVKVVMERLDNPPNFLSIAIGIVAFLYASSAALLDAQARLCMICQLTPVSPQTVHRALRRYAEAIAIVLLVALLLTVSLAVREIVLLAPEAWIAWIEFLVSYLFAAVLLTCNYRILSSRRIDWGYCWYASIITCLVLMLGRQIIEVTLLRFPFMESYGQAGLLMILMLWVYYSAQVFYFGAELIQARRTRSEWME